MYNNNAVDDILLIIQLFYERNVFTRCGKNAAEHDDITPNTAANRMPGIDKFAMGRSSIPW